MNTPHSIENTAAGLPPQFRNYDVLLAPRSSDGQPLRLAPGDSVGNQRFLVLLRLVRPRYLRSLARGDEDGCRALAVDLWETVCKKCVPHGRFFERLGGEGSGWRRLECDDPSAMAMMRKALECEPAEHHDTPEPSMTPEVVRSMPKRVSWSSLDDSSMTKDSSMVSSPAPFDVVCEDKRGLRPATGRQHTGNNRLKVMLDLRMNKYRASNKLGKERLAAEVVSSIIDDASGRFLRADAASGMYEVLSREAATVCAKNAFGAATEGKKLAAKNLSRQAEVRRLVQHKRKKVILGPLERSRGRNAVNNELLPTTFNLFQTTPIIGSC